jgi:hypothetical protein
MTGKRLAVGHEGPSVAWAAAWAHAVGVDERVAVLFTGMLRGWAESPGAATIRGHRPILVNHQGWET